MDETISPISEENLRIVCPSDNAWRSIIYNMLIREQRYLAEVISYTTEGAAEGMELDTSRILSPSTLRIATNSGLLDNEMLEKLGLSDFIKSPCSIESKFTAYSPSLLLEKSNISSKEESTISYDQGSEIFRCESDFEGGGIAVHPSNIVKALRLLHVPPFPTTFEAEEEMIQVYQLIYDALRYRIVFDQALNAISFYLQFPKLQMQDRMVHILFFDLHQRQFLSRDNFSSGKNEVVKDVSKILFEPEEKECEEFKELVREAECALWDLRVHLAASVARLRIKRRAFSLLSMLPKKLRNPSHLDGSAKRPLSFWINTFLIRRNTIAQIFKDSGLKLLDQDLLNPRLSSIVEIEDDNYFYDKYCTNLIFSHPGLRNAITHSQLVKENFLVIQDRSFCLGPSVLCQKLSELEVSGAIVQTHISSVRVTAYLASLLNENKSPMAIKPDVVLAFGAGDKKQEYEASLKAMGITNVSVYSEPWVQVANKIIGALLDASELYATTFPNIAISPDFTESSIVIPKNMEKLFEQLDNAVAVYATPPNSYSAVPDPVELAVTRGGDIRLLEDITRSMSFKYEIAQDDILNGTETKEEEARLIALIEKEREKEEKEEEEKMNQLAKEQMQVLSVCLSLPQIQMVVYETHSTNYSENNNVVDNVVKAANTAAGLNFINHQDDEGDENKIADEEADQVKMTKENVTEVENPEIGEEENKTLTIENEIPLTDIFEVEDIPGTKEAVIEDGCFISFIKRKELIRINNRYLIQMAEARGLFGKRVGSKQASPSQSAKGGRGKRKGRQSSLSSDDSGEYSQRPHSKSKQLEIERIAAPTVASLRRSTKWSKGNINKRVETKIKHRRCESIEHSCERCARHGDDDSPKAKKAERKQVEQNDNGIEREESDVDEEVLKRLRIPTIACMSRQKVLSEEERSKISCKRRSIDSERSYLYINSYGEIVSNREKAGYNTEIRPSQGEVNKSFDRNESESSDEWKSFPNQKYYQNETEDATTSDSDSDGKRNYSRFQESCSISEYSSEDEEVKNKRKNLREQSVEKSVTFSDENVYLEDHESVSNENGIPSEVLHSHDLITEVGTRYFVKDDNETDENTVEHVRKSEKNISNYPVDKTKFGSVFPGLVFQDNGPDEKRMALTFSGVKIDKTNYSKEKLNNEPINAKENILNRKGTSGSISIKEKSVVTERMVLLPSQSQNDSDSLGSIKKKNYETLGKATEEFMQSGGKPQKTSTRYFKKVEEKDKVHVTTVCKSKSKEISIQKTFQKSDVQENKNERKASGVREPYPLKKVDIKFLYPDMSIKDLDDLITDWCDSIE